MKDVFEDIEQFVGGLELIDTHEHLPPREELRDRETDVLKEYLTHYFNRDLISAGLSRADYELAIRHDLPLRRRWQLLEPYWEIARFTGYGRALDIAVKGLYGMDRVCGATLEQLNERFVDSLQPGHYDLILHRKAKIRTCLLDNSNQLDLQTENLSADPVFFRPVYRLDKFILPRQLSDVKEVERELNTDVGSLQDWQDACLQTLDMAVDHGMVALKCGLAYERSLSFERATQAEAERCFNSVLQRRHLPEWVIASVETDKAFQDYMMHFVLSLANRRRLPFQFHTGLQEGSGNCILNSNPALLSNLFLEYPQVRFDLFHMGYPYQQLLSALSKNFPNVFIDMCWAHIISPEASVRALEEWLDAVPYNKISAFGGDYRIIDAVYGHQILARLNVSRALSRKVQQGCFDLDTAKAIARRLFLDNPAAIFQIDSPGIASWKGSDDRS